MTYLPGQQYVRNASGVWTPVGYGQTGDSALPTSMSSPAGRAAGLHATVTAYGNQRVTMEPTTLFSDPFDAAGGYDTANRWTTGGTVAPTLVTGAALINAGTAASASSSLVSKPTFPPVGLGFLAFGQIARFETINSTAGTPFFLNSHRFMGLGTVPATWTTTYTAGSTTANPLLSGVGFEIDTDGLMYPVVYDNGTRVRANLLSTGAPGNLNTGRTLADGNAHQFLVIMRPDIIVWYVDSTDVPVATYTFRTPGFSTPDVATLPLRYHTLNSATAPSGTMSLRVGAVAVADTGRNADAISDGTYAWRKAGVTDPATQFINAMTTGSQGPAVNVNPNSIQKATYFAQAQPTQGLSLASGTPKVAMSLHHAATSTRTVRVRRVLVGLQNGATAANIYTEIRRGTAAPTTAGTAGSIVSAHPGSPASDTVVNHQGTLAITSVGSLHTQHFGSVAANALVPSTVVYDWQESGETIPLTIRPGFTDSISIWLTANVATIPTPYITVIYTEE